MLDYLLEAFTGPGSLFMYAITALMCFSLAVLVERALVFARARPDMAGVRSALSSGPASSGAVDRAVAAAGATPLAAVLRAGAEAPDAEQSWDAMAPAAAEAEALLSRRVEALNAVSNLATMLGLLGTVYGLMVAFSALGDAAAGARAARLSEGITTAMATTAFGLLVAIPSLALHSGLSGFVRARLAEIEIAAGLLAALRKRPSSGA